MRGGHRLLLVADGVSVHTVRLAKGLVDAGMDVHVATFEASPDLSGTVHMLGAAAPSNDMRYPMAVPKLARLIRQLRPVAVNAHYLSSYGAMSAIAVRMQSRRHRPRLVQTVWGSDVLVAPRRSAFHRHAAKAWLRSADLVTGDSQDIRADVVRLAPKASWHTFVFGPERSLLEAPRRTEPVVLSARRLERDMRIDLVIEAFRRLQLDSGSGYRLIVSSSGSMESELKRLAIGVPRVDFVGHLDRPALHELLEIAQVAVSVPESDGTSAALMDALAAGVTPVVNDLPANREWVDPDVGVIVSRDPNPQELADAMATALADPPRTERIRAAVAEHTWEAELARFTRRIDQLVEER